MSNSSLESLGFESASKYTAHNHSSNDIPEPVHRNYWLTDMAASQTFTIDKSHVVIPKNTVHPRDGSRSRKSSIET